MCNAALALQIACANKGTCDVWRRVLRAGDLLFLHVTWCIKEQWKVSCATLQGRAQACTHKRTQITLQHAARAPYDSQREHAVILLSCSNDVTNTGCKSLKHRVQQGSLCKGL